MCSFRGVFFCGLHCYASVFGASASGERSSSSSVAWIGRAILRRDESCSPTSSYTSSTYSLARKHKNGFLKVWRKDGLQRSFHKSGRSSLKTTDLPPLTSLKPPCSLLEQILHDSLRAMHFPRVCHPADVPRKPCEGIATENSSWNQVLHAHDSI